MSIVANSALATSHNSYITGNEDSTMSMNKIALDDLPQVSDNDFMNHVSSFMDSVQGNSQSMLQSMTGNMSPKSLLNVQQQMINYSVAMQVTSKGVGEIAKGINQLASIQ